MSLSLAERLVRWRWLFVVLVFAFVGFAVSGVRFLGFSNDYWVFFSEENP